MIIKAASSDGTRDLTDKVQVDTGRFDKDKPGKYLIKFKLTDNGVSVNDYAIVNVLYNLFPSEPDPDPEPQPEPTPDPDVEPTPHPEPVPEPVPKPPYVPTPDEPTLDPDPIPGGADIPPIEPEPPEA